MDMGCEYEMVYITHYASVKGYTKCIKVYRVAVNLLFFPIRWCKNMLVGWDIPKRMVAVIRQNKNTHFKIISVLHIGLLDLYIFNIHYI